METLTQWMTTIFDPIKIKNILQYQEGNPLLFNTGLFLILFVFFLLIYQFLKNTKYTKMLFVIAFSLYFYYKSSAEYCLILIGVCLSDYVLGNLLGITTSIIRKKIIVAINILSNIGMLIYFKYFNLLISTFANIASTSFDPLNIILPAGISFFTFRSISYIVDVYRGEMPPVKNFLDYLFFLSFFPPLLAGPVVRAKDLIPQIQRNALATKEMISEGYFLIMIGLIKKVVIADFISENFVDRIFENPSLYSGFENLLGMYGFTLQLYCDFSGYSDMAIGLALILGYRFAENFNSPFKSQNPSEFWRRWHISLSSWLRDYLYIPMGGSRKSRLRSRLNLLYTMVIGGLWHGASWMFLIWGAWNGLLLVIHKELKFLFPKRENKGENPWWKRTFNIFMTFTLIAFGMIFFRASSMEHVQDMLIQISTNFHLSVFPQFIENYTLIVVAIISGLLLHFTPHRWAIGLQHNYNKLHYFFQGIILAVVLFCVIQVRQSDIVPFIYLQY